MPLTDTSSWCSGLTGIILTIIVIVMYVFAIEYSRRHVFQAFWTTHSLYIPLYFFLTLHGAGQSLARVVVVVVVVMVVVVVVVVGVAEV